MLHDNNAITMVTCELVTAHFGKMKRMYWLLNHVESLCQLQPKVLTWKRNTTLPQTRPSEIIMITRSHVCAAIAPCESASKNSTLIELRCGKMDPVQCNRKLFNTKIFKQSFLCLELKMYNTLFRRFSNKLTLSDGVISCSTYTASSTLSDDTFAV